MRLSHRLARVLLVLAVLAAVAAPLASAGGKHGGGKHGGGYGTLAAWGS